MGRPTILSPEIQAKLVESFELGQTSIKVACAYVGIGESTYYQWMDKGRAGEPDYVEFVEAIEKARSSAIMVNLAVIRKAAREGHWQAAAWWLERVFPLVYGRRTQIEVVTLDVVEAEIQRLERALEVEGDGSRPALPAP